jgi:hypothetical protein
MASNHVGRTCPFCQGVIKPDDTVVMCSQCGTYHHEECWNEHGQCTTPGCHGSAIAVGGRGGRPAPDLVIDDSDFDAAPAPARPAAPRRQPVAAPVAAATRSKTYGQAMGPKGKERNPFLAVILFPILTLGIYSLFWYFSLWNEARGYAHGRNGVKIHSGAGAFCLYSILPFLVMIGGSLLLGNLTGWMWEGGIGYVGMIPGLLLFVVGLVKTAGLPRRMRLAKGVLPAQAGHPGALVLFCLIPWVGGLIFWMCVQSAINKFWREEA